MSGRVLIVGQGLAGTALGLELEAAGVDFVVASEGHAAAASRVAAGLVNPVTGQRWVKSAGVDALLPEAKASYERWGRLLGVALWHPLKLKRLWRDATERAAIEAKIARGELAPYVSAHETDERGATVAGTAWVDLPALLAAAAARWRMQGRLREQRVLADELHATGAGVAWQGNEFSAVILCVGAGRVARERFAFAPFATAKGEMLAVNGTRLPRDSGLSRGTWLIAGEGGTARVGATYERDRDDLELTGTARAKLLAAAREISGDPLEVTAQSAGVRLTLPDRLPLVGWHPQLPRLGIFGALASKGTLWAPHLARHWVAVLRGEAADFPAEVAVGRLGRSK